jgi:hypothetical protein
MHASRSLATDPARQLDVLWHDGDALGVDGTQVGVLKQTGEIGLTGLLKGHDCVGLESQVRLEVLGNLPDEALERQLPDEKLRALLVPADLPEGHSARPEAVWLLQATLGWSRLASCLAGKLLPGRRASRGLASCLLGASHVWIVLLISDVLE